MITATDAKLFIGDQFVATVKHCEIQHEHIQPLTEDTHAVRSRCPELSIRLDDDVFEQMRGGLFDTITEKAQAEGERRANEKYRKVVEVAWGVVQEIPVPIDSVVEFLKETSPDTETQIVNLKPGQAFVWNDMLWMYTEKQPSGKIGLAEPVREALGGETMTAWLAAIESLKGEQCQIEMAKKVLPCPYPVYSLAERFEEEKKANTEAMMKKVSDELDEIPF